MTFPARTRNSTRPQCAAVGGLKRGFSEELRVFRNGFCGILERFLLVLELHRVIALIPGGKRYQRNARPTVKPL